MKKLFFTTIMKPPEIIVNKFFCLCFFFLFACSKVQAVKADTYLLRYYLNDLNFTGTMRSRGASRKKHNTTTYALNGCIESRGIR